MFSLIAFLSCNRQSETNTQDKDVSLNNKGFEFLQAYYDECDDKKLDSARFCFEESLKLNFDNSSAYNNLLLVLGAKNEYEEMIELIQERIGHFPSEMHMAKAESNSMLAILYEKKGDTLTSKKMEQNASQEFDTCFEKYVTSIDLVVSFLCFVAYRDGKNSALHELTKYKDVFPDKDYYNAFESQLMEFEPNDYFNSKCN